MKRQNINAFKWASCAVQQKKQMTLQHETTLNATDIGLYALEHMGPGSQENTGMNNYML